MAYFKDLTPCRYFDQSPYLHGFTKLLAIGWIDEGKKYKRGHVDKNFIDKIKFLYEESHPRVYYMGFHGCSICNDNMGDDQLFIPGENKIYVCPGKIDHYIEKHNYCPPEEFILAVKNIDNLYDKEYIKKIRGIDKIVYWFLKSEFSDNKIFDAVITDKEEIYPWAEKWNKISEKEKKKREEKQKRLETKEQKFVQKGKEKIRKKFEKSSFSEKVKMLSQFFSRGK